MMDSKKTDEYENLSPKVIYQPKYKETQLERFRIFVEKKFCRTFDDYWKFHEWSCQNFPEFWECAWEFFEIICSQSYQEVYDRKRSFDNMEWFKGARFNYAENVFKYKDSHVALIATDASDNEEFITYRRMYVEVCQYAASMRSMDIKKGDYVICYMSNKKEAVFAFLATASIGAIWMGALPLLGVKAALSRFQQVRTKLLFSSGNFFFEKKEIKMLEKLKAIVEGLPSLVKVVFVPTKGRIVEDISHIPKCCTINEFLAKSKKEYKSNPWELEYEQVPFDHPLDVLFTSGTTGLPKAVCHSAGAFITTLKDFGIHLGITRKDVLLNYLPAGGICWHALTNTLHLGTTLCLYDGNPERESPTRFWDLIDRLGLSYTALISSAADEMKAKGFGPNETHSLKTLRYIITGACVTKPSTHEFLARITSGRFTMPYYGTVEISSDVSGVNTNLPVYKGEHHAFSLGMDARCVDENGKEVLGQRGTLILAKPFPSLPIKLLHDENKEKLRRSYLSRYPGYWYIGDDVWINSVTKGFVVYGRCDEILNPKGFRFNCSEIHSALSDIPTILDCVCISQYNKKKEERSVLFVKMEPNITLSEDLKQKIRRTIENALSFKHVPELIIQVPDVPYNCMGKKLNLVVKKIINKMPVSNLEFIVNPKSIEFYKHLELGDF